MATRRWGMEPQQWDEAAARLEALLLDAASRRSTVTYGEAARVAFEGRFSARSGALMDLLGDVDSRLDEERGVMIAALVVRADTGRPGEGFFAFARDDLGRDVADREAMWQAEAQRVWDVYGAGR
jgi:hypothetical protein